VSTSAAISGSFAWMSATIAPIGSSTSGIQASSALLITGSIGRFLMEGTPREAGGDEEHQHSEQSTQRVLGQRLRDLDTALDTGDRTDSDEQTGAQVDVAVPALPPRPDDDRRQDREQRGRLRVYLGQPEHQDERGHEEDAAPDAEEPSEDAADEAENRREDLHQTSRRIPTAVRTSAKPSVRVRPVTRCCSATPPMTPSTPGIPSSAAAPNLTSPCRAYATVPAAAVSEIAASDVPVAARVGTPASTSTGTMMIPPPTPKSALNTPAARPIASSRAITGSYRMAVAAEDLLASLAERPGEAAILLDVDGTLAPIAARPELAEVPEDTRAELRRLVAR